MRVNILFKSLFIGIPISITFFDSVGYVARVEGVSMQPALNPNASKTDYVYLSRWAVRDYNINRGDIISLISPKNPEQIIIKRVVALEGDIINTPYYKRPYMKIPEGHCWVEGDHTGHSLDSNFFGPVSLGLITAKASCIIWPPARWQKLGSYIPKQRQQVYVENVQ
ncbi:mitochondrial inner membrane protease subunit 2-like [Ctenocephalides felis]|uniref:mitochondrial inner membrane protease subunit 2-like n=1 Tax=Ctenocephalides felis TaxID=7515 RepID=UPI000E6E585F|nr:mitochondrial inner membrane protease subunit 2-like [Ctenocephalides felis]